MSILKPDHEYFETNIRGAENVCAFAEKHGIKKIVFTSSIAPYGAAEALKEETTLPTPNTPYGISKLVAEKIHQIWQTKDSDNRQLTIVRPGVVFGKGENGNFTRLYWGIRKHTFAYPGRKDTIKACIYVKELVRFMLYNRTHCTGDEKNNRVDAVRTLYSERLDYACRLHRPMFGKPDGYLSGTGEEAPDIHQYLWQEACRFGLSFSLHV